MRVLGIILLFGMIICCNNMCNGHGECGKRDKCECYPGFGGADCSLRGCPYSAAWFGTSNGDLNHDGKITDVEVKTEWYPNYGINEEDTKAHAYAECSGSGNCDNNKGECKCYNGYEGAACQRTTCPSNNEKLICSGHGICENIEYNLATSSNPYTGWEITKMYSCKCDKGYRGLDCSERECQYGIDAAASEPPKMNLYYITYDVCGKFRLNYTYDGITYISEELYAPNQYELYSHPQRKIDYNNRLTDIIQLIPPLSSCIAYYSPVEIQTIIQCYNIDIDKFLKSKITGECIRLSAPASETPEQYECGNNGLCNRKTGLCECFQGFSGPACDNKKEVVLNDNRAVQNDEDSVTNRMINELFDL